MFARFDLISAPEVPFVILVRAVNSVDQSDSEEVCAFTQQGSKEDDL